MAADTEKTMSVEDVKDLMGAMSPSASQDPVQALAQILSDFAGETKAADREKLIHAHETRFANRRKMAYWSLTALLALGGVVLGGALIDGVNHHPLCEAADATSADLKDVGCSAIVASLAEATTLLSVLIGTLTAVVLSYYLSSAIKPSS